MRTWILGEFTTSESLLDATRKMREAGFKNLDTYSPYPLHHGSEALGLPRSKIPFIVLVAALTGACTGYGMQWYMNAYDFPINVGNRLAHSFPTMIPVTFELSILFAAFGAVFGTLALARFPTPYHPVFEVEAFRNASLHGFWMSVVVDTGSEQQARAQTALQDFGAKQVSTVEEPSK